MSLTLPLEMSDLGWLCVLRFPPCIRSPGGRNTKTSDERRHKLPARQVRDEGGTAQLPETVLKCAVVLIVTYRHRGRNASSGKSATLEGQGGEKEWCHATSSRTDAASQP